MLKQAAKGNAAAFDRLEATWNKVIRLERTGAQAEARALAAGERPARLLDDVRASIAKYVSERSVGEIATRKDRPWPTSSAHASVTKRTDGACGAHRGAPFEHGARAVECLFHMAEILQTLTATRCQSRSQSFGSTSIAGAERQPLRLQQLARSARASNELDEHGVPVWKRSHQVLLLASSEERCT
jgi:hypothetical protein